MAGLDYTAAAPEKKDAPPAQSSIEKFVSFSAGSSNKKDKVETPDIEEIEKNILSEYTNDPLTRKNIRTASGVVGAILTPVIGFWATQDYLLHRSTLSRAFRRALFLPFFVYFGYFLGHQVGAAIVNTSSRRKKKKIVVGYDSENKPITVDVFAPEDLKSEPFYKNLLTNF